MVLRTVQEASASATAASTSSSGASVLTNTFVLTLFRPFFSQSSVRVPAASSRSSLKAMPRASSRSRIVIPTQPAMPAIRKSTGQKPDTGRSSDFIVRLIKSL